MATEFRTMWDEHFDEGEAVRLYWWVLSSIVIYFTYNAGRHIRHLSYSNHEYLTHWTMQKVNIVR